MATPTPTQTLPPTANKPHLTPAELQEAKLRLHRGGKKLPNPAHPVASALSTAYTAKQAAKTWELSLHPPGQDDRLQKIEANTQEFLNLLENVQTKDGALTLVPFGQAPKRPIEPCPPSPAKRLKSSDNAEISKTPPTLFSLAALANAVAAAPNPYCRLTALANASLRFSFPKN